ncbi:carbohydrate ABC transporter permease [Jiella sp. M17.18]|uniref:carbohydrate ABC transporter permease n=1 Tax=Jiella sp. M17.18 TaxID=3234247 RepID=UPI0034DE30CB
MAETTAALRALRPDTASRPAGGTRALEEPEATPRRRTSRLGLLMLAPTLLLLGVFFLVPAVLTGIFAFTTMSSATGISGGAYVFTANRLDALAGSGVPPETITELRTERAVVDAAGLAAAAKAGVDERFLADIKATLLGQSFAGPRDFKRALQALPNHPRRIFELKQAMEPFSHAILNTRFATRDQAAAAIRSVAPDIEPAVLDRLLSASYTGWVWTSENFVRLLTQPQTLRLCLNTVFYVAVTLGFSVAISLFLALATFYLPRRTATAFSALWLLPKITPVVLYAILWKWFTWEGGFLPILAGHLGLPAFNYMKGSVPTAWTIVIMVNGFVGASIGMILLTSALRAIPVQQLWASEVDGASRWQQVRRIILPQLKWPILFFTIYQAMSLMSSYEQIWLTTDGGPGNTTDVWALEAFRVALFDYTGNLRYGLGAAMALILVAVGLIVSLLLLRLFNFSDLVEQPRIET